MVKKLFLITIFLSSLLILRGQELNKKTAHSDKVTAIIFNQDGSRALSSSFDNTIKLWDTKTCNQLLAIQDSNKIAMSLAFSKDNSSFACGFWDKTILIYDVGTNKIKTKLDNHNSIVRQVVYGNQGKYLYSCSEDGIISIWNVLDYSLFYTLYASDRILSMAISKNEDKLVAGLMGGKIDIWDLNTRKKHTYTAHSSNVLTVAISPFSDEFISSGSDGLIKVWDLNTGNNKGSIPYHKSSVLQLKYLNNENSFISISWDRKMVVFNSKTREVLKVLNTNNLQLECFDISLDDKYILVGSREKIIIKIDIKENKIIQELY
nr:WD40 repeat domain-containing protein [uncultured Carboxylicivirga sp.]